MSVAMISTGDSSIDLHLYIIAPEGYGEITASLKILAMCYCEILERQNRMTHTAVERELFATKCQRCSTSQSVGTFNCLYNVFGSHCHLLYIPVTV
jgi:hypothetical protein